MVVAGGCALGCVGVSSFSQLLLLVRRSNENEREVQLCGGGGAPKEALPFAAKFLSW